MRIFYFLLLWLSVFLSGCGDGPDAKDKEISRLNSEIQSVNAIAQNLQREIDSLKGTVAQKEARISELEERIKWAKENFRINFPGEKPPITGDISKEVFGGK